MSYKLGLIGYPAKHSLSPWIHHQFLQQTGLDGGYEIYETPPPELGDRIQEFKQTGMNGFNITVPFKQQVIPYLDEVDTDARLIGAVNTVVSQNCRLKGYNTDGIGYVEALRQAYPDLFTGDKNVLLLGAGGAARGIYRALVTEGFPTVDIANRTTEKAEALLELKEPDTKTRIINYDQAERILGDYDVIVHTTSIGMTPEVNKQILSLNRLKPHTVVSDIVYNPLTTQLLASAEVKNARIHRGHAMLLYQALHAFRIWTGKTTSGGQILKQLEQRLRGNKHVNR
ncbi:shikimate dehydrogenase [Sediminibacillus massiliensis]|uniref:shikimate dehydrogenase n=1 Tax=Sediminibacillus massiliensis TaxID=1926277 RepID=UPI00098839A1|nr:shikimate dehydrogenase [Sediminibacillus massiliensis]